MGKIVIGGFMAIVIVIECAVAWFLIPSQQKIEEIAESKVVEKIKESHDHNDPAHAHEGGIYVAWYLQLLLLTIHRPNLEDRVATATVAEGWRPSRRAG